jgi:hypothetical protein
MFELVVHGHCLRNPLTHFEATRHQSGFSANISYFVQTVVVPKKTRRHLKVRLVNNDRERFFCRILLISYQSTKDSVS